MPGADEVPARAFVGEEGDDDDLRADDGAGCRRAKIPNRKAPEPSVLDGLGQRESSLGIGFHQEDEREIHYSNDNAGLLAMLS
jgi:hypothetical protein